MKHVSFLVLCVLGCSGLSIADAPPDSDPDAQVLPRDVGLFITESSGPLDAAAIETIATGTHRRYTVTGLGLDPDMQLRKLRDRDGKDHFFTVQSSQGVVIERDRQGRAVRQFDVAESGQAASRANPLDVAFDASDRLWITRHGSKSLLVFSDEKTVATTIDLGAFADDDGIPDMSAIAILGDTAYVALRRLEKGFGTTKNKSTVVAIDTKTFAVRPFVDLPAKDPGPEFHVHDGALFVSCIGGPLLPEPDRDAALVRIDVANATAKKLLAADQTDGFVTAFQLVDTWGYAIVAAFAAENPTSLVRFDLESGKIDATWAKTSTYRLWDVAYVRDLLLVTDRTEQAPGIRVLSAVDGAKLGTIPTKLLPIEVVPMFPEN